MTKLQRPAGAGHGLRGGVLKDAISDIGPLAFIRPPIGGPEPRDTNR